MTKPWWAYILYIPALPFLALFFFLAWPAILVNEAMNGDEWEKIVPEIGAMVLWMGVVGIVIWMIV